MLTASRCVKFEVICKGLAHLTHSNCIVGHCHSASCPAPAERGKGQFKELAQHEGQLRAEIKNFISSWCVCLWHVWSQVSTLLLHLRIVWAMEPLFSSGVGLNLSPGKV